ncbi:hypothetical protein ACO03V_06745 [Microbacterium sp. HMH0099]|uniref:hypothetical protein n=1 Tax=Microbacterium sp. HMH0099 TaxID=3414026 RepID=UPI003BF6DE57
MRRGIGARRGALVAALAGTVLALAPVVVSAATAAPSAASAGMVLVCPTPSAAPTPAPTGAPSDGVGITAVVCGPTAASGGGTSPTAGLGGARGSSSSTGSRSGSGSATGTAQTPSSVAPGTTDDAVAEDAVDLGGILSIGGLTTGSSLSLNPFGGDVQVSFTVRNTSRSTIDATADFWMENAFGMRLATVDGVAVAGLKPGETRTVGADLPGAGQWTVLTTHARLNPPAQVDGVDLSSLTRDATVIVVPWLLLLMLLGSAVAATAVVLLRRAVLGPVLTEAPA